jgi:hypothetical protein
LLRDLDALRNCGRDRLDTLSLYPRTTRHILQVMASRGRLELVYPANGVFDVVGISRFCGYALGNRLIPRFEWWGRFVAVRITLRGEIEAAVDQIDACFGHVFGLRGPFALEFHRMGLRSVTIPEASS